MKWLDTLKLLLFASVPRGLISQLVGKLVAIKFPGPLGAWLNEAFVKVFSVNMEEAEFDLGEYRTIQDIFTRKLKPGARTVTGPICSPCDGQILGVGTPVSKEMALQVKGSLFSLTDLVFGTGQSRQVPDAFNPTAYGNFYLAPHNYHRVHSPVAGKLESIVYVPGDLWPVNFTAVRCIPRLYCVNERLVFKIKLQEGHLYVVMIGAFNVGKFVTPWWPEFNPSPIIHCEKSLVDADIRCGEELGTFAFGSSVVLVFDGGSVRAQKEFELDAARAVRMGEDMRELFL